MFRSSSSLSSGEAAARPGGRDHAKHEYLRRFDAELHGRTGTLECFASMAMLFTDAWTLRKCFRVWETMPSAALLEMQFPFCVLDNNRVGFGRDQRALVPSGRSCGRDQRAASFLFTRFRLRFKRFLETRASELGAGRKVCSRV